MIIKNSPSPKNSNQAQEIGHIKYSYKESFKRENKSILDDSEFIENYNNALKSPQSRRLYKDAENEIHLDSIEAHNILPLDKISI
ncbi:MULTISPECIES: poly-A polymerase [unclassified Prochlorococcus]|uniref:poly-A polymerase n=1 Tax=unclassified Prochlorococcus TaxID=2627481 RepID=UPI00097CC791|nr:MULTISPECIES: poly-A polymerase [unclassified Prochlorococcus]AQL30899.1 poly-A polymerase [Prochlorococcus sp. RS50]AQL32161.1 poly-A polymerase [Prochlorococcus sp. RS01]AQL33423.1 poly-A polymerase [Prochlorococcus sp. RS04]